MVFNIPKNYQLRESYKERNLYYKYFAGYFFNELIPSVEDRTYAFVKLLQEIILNNENRYSGDKIIIKQKLNTFLNESKYVTFDYHIAQFDKSREDRGEMSDVLLYSDNHLISIECKYLSNMSFKKDILQIQNRIQVAENKFHSNGLQVLLMKKSKFNNSAKRNGNFIVEFNKEKLKIPTIILLWEDLLNLTDNNVVKKYLANQLKRN